MSTVDPIAALLADIDRPVSPRPEFGTTLRAQLLAELRASTSIGITRRQLTVPARPRWSRLKIALVLIVIFLLLAGVATATYLAVRDWGGGRVTIANVPNNGVDSVSGIGPDGRVRTVWRCPHNVFCGEVVGIAWAPDRRRLALSLDEIGGQSLYVGLHVIDTQTDKDTQIPPVRGATSTRAERLAALEGRPGTGDVPDIRLPRPARPGVVTGRIEDRLLMHRPHGRLYEPPDLHHQHRRLTQSGPPGRSRQQHMAVLVTRRHPDRLLDR